MFFRTSLTAAAALLVALSAQAQTLVPQPSPSRLPVPSIPTPSLPIVPEGKGTIGLICTDMQGKTVSYKKNDPDPRASAAFETCVRDVVGEWEKVIEEKNIDVTDVDLNEFLGGYKSYRYEAETMRASQMRRHRH